MAETIKVLREENIVTLFLNRAGALNAFDIDMVQSFTGQLMSLATDNSVRAVVISGEGKAFCVGGDIRWALGFSQGPAAAFHKLAGYLHLGVMEIRRMSKPVIAAVNGIAAGAGFSLALACDFRVMAQSAMLRQAYTSNGLSIDGGGTFMLPRLVGMARALEIAAFDLPISSEQALAWGLATRISKDGGTLDEAVKMARELETVSLNSFHWSKKLLTDSFNTSFEAHIERERDGLSSCAAHPDGQEGLAAFIAKRKPSFLF